MIRRIITIDEELCNGCGACVEACHEGAIALVDGKARLMRDDYCDGLGDCLPTCPTNAISFEEREAAAYDEEAVKQNQATKEPAVIESCCAGSRAQTLQTNLTPPRDEQQSEPSQLAQWPAQIKLVPVKAPYFEGAHLLIAADCAAYAYASFHSDFMQGRVTLIGCPKLDEGDYSEKLAAILAQNDVLSVTVARMEVPCCGGLEYAVSRALEASGKALPYSVVTISTDGRVLQ